MNSDHLMLTILDFMTVVHECYSNTTFANDRSVYAKDLATAMGWIVELRTGINNQIVENNRRIIGTLPIFSRIIPFRKINPYPESPASSLPGIHIRKNLGSVPYFIYFIR